MILKASISVLVASLGLYSSIVIAGDVKTETLMMDSVSGQEHKDRSSTAREPEVMAEAKVRSGSNTSSAVDKLYERIHPITSLTASFKQRISDHEGFALQDSEGVLKLQRPNKLYWETLAPLEQKVVSNGETLWVYDPDLEQVTVHSNAQSMEGPMTLLAESKASLSSRFQVEAAQKGDFELFTLEPLEVSGETDNAFASLSFEFFKGTLSQIIMVDKLRQKTAISLTGVKLNPVINAKEFEFVAPDGVDVVLNE